MTTVPKQSDRDNLKTSHFNQEPQDSHTKTQISSEPNKELNLFKNQQSSKNKLNSVTMLPSQSLVFLETIKLMAKPMVLDQQFQEMRRIGEVPFLPGQRRNRVKEQD